jgi:hypothetical protein
MLNWRAMKPRRKRTQNDIHIRLAPLEMQLIDLICRIDRRSRAGLAALIISEWIGRTFAAAAPSYPEDAVKLLYERWRRTSGDPIRSAPPAAPPDIEPR